MTSSIEDSVSDYLQGAAIYDVATDLVTEIIEEHDGPDIVSCGLMVQGIYVYRRWDYKTDFKRW